jgi:hypothetical protein
MSSAERPGVLNHVEETGDRRETTSRDVQHWLKRLSSGESVQQELIACGSLAVGPLRDFLLNGEPSIAYQPRRMAVEALAALGARQTLLQYLNRRPEIMDPAARLGEQAVQSAAAKELSAAPTPEILQAIAELVEPPVQLGFVEALGKCGHADAIPYFVRALEDDACRGAAEDGLRMLGDSLTPFWGCA